jgi:hypothetical protein
VTEPQQDCGSYKSNQLRLHIFFIQGAQNGLAEGLFPMGFRSAACHCTLRGVRRSPWPRLTKSFRCLRAENDGVALIHACFLATSYWNCLPEKAACDPQIDGFLVMAQQYLLKTRKNL